MDLNFDIAIVAPYPTADRVREGWMSRIGCIDAVLQGHRRLYVHFGLHHTVQRDGVPVQQAPNGCEICLNQSAPEHRRLFDEIVTKARGVYVHTVHLAEFVAEWLPSGKFIVDIHGVVPEEETMLGRPENAPRYALIEQQVLRHAKTAVVVSNAMAAHYRAKYPDLSPRFLRVPVFEEYDGDAPAREGDDDALPVSVVFAGGTQAWQNVDAMLQLAQDCRRFARFTLFSHEHELLRQRAAERCPDATIHTGFCNKPGIPRMYQTQQFGLVLRDDTAVNRVACPTKLSEYLKYGVIPVVRSPDLGDFAELGYCYSTEGEFRDGFLPDARTRRWMREANQAVLVALRQAFRQSAAGLRELVVSEPRSTGAL